MHMAVVSPQRLQSSGILIASEAHATWFDTKSSENSARIHSCVNAPPNRSQQAESRLLRRDSAIPSERSLIAVVDDEPVIAITLAEILIRHGFDAVWFSCPAEALDFFTARHADLLLSDVSMPTIDGIALAAKILDLTSECAIILLSARSYETEVWQRVRLLSADVHLEAKPLNVVSLVTTVRRMLAKFRNESLSHEGPNDAALKQHPAR